MIDKVLGFLQQELDQYLLGGQFNNVEGKVKFPAEEPDDAVRLPGNCIVPLLVRIEEEKTVRFDDRYLRSSDHVNFTTAPPAVPLHLYVLFVARFTDYLEGMKNLSRVVQFFQGHPLLAAPDLPELRIELHSPTFTAQNEVWGALRLPQHPAVMYKVTLVMLEDEGAATAGAVVKKDGVLVTVEDYETLSEKLNSTINKQ